MNPMAASDPQVQEIIDKMLKGDPRCPIPISARVEKTNTESGDILKDGHLGYVRGNIYMNETTSAYLVEWDGVTVPKEVDGFEIVSPYIFIADFRIREVK
jgi:hypothetical protein